MRDLPPTHLDLDRATLYPRRIASLLPLAGSVSSPLAALRKSALDAEAKVRAMLEAHPDPKLQEVTLATILAHWLFVSTVFRFFNRYLIRSSRQVLILLEQQRSAADKLSEV